LKKVSTFIGTYFFVQIPGHIAQESQEVSKITVKHIDKAY